jgi:ankyrin repeat protein
MLAVGFLLIGGAAWVYYECCVPRRDSIMLAILHRDLRDVHRHLSRYPELLKDDPSLAREAISASASTGFYDACKALIEHGALDGPDGDQVGMEAAVLAIGNSHDRVLSLIASHLADINAIDSNGFALLHYAACQTDVVYVDALLDCDADPNILSSEGITPLDYAYLVGEPDKHQQHRQVRMRLRKAGAKLNVVTMPPEE